MFIEDGQIYSSLSQKQAGVIFRNWKQGNINLEETTIKEIYKLVNDGFSIYCDKDTFARCDDDLFEAIKCLFANEFEKAERLIKSVTYSHFHAKYDDHYTYEQMMRELNKEEN